jgi:hypothetical protein
MTLRKIIWLLEEDTFYIHMNQRNHETAEYIEASAKGSWKELRKYFDYEVISICREEYAMSIVLKEK